VTAFLTIFSAPKAFTDPHIAIIQRNAITSWTKLIDVYPSSICLANRGIGVEVLLFGDEIGLAETAGELGVKHIQDISRSPSGAPIMSAMFQLAREKSPSQLYCIVNADIILFSSLVETARLVAAQKEKFVLLGQRWDMDITSQLDFGLPSLLQSNVQSQGQLHRPAGSDYFLFPNSCYTELPPFTVGRAGWDNWMIYHARKKRFPAIDATRDITIIHQNHDYSHLPNGKPHYKHPETNENIRLAGGRAMTRFTLRDTDYYLENGRILPTFWRKMDSAHLWRRIEAWPLLTLGSTRLSNALWRLRKTIFPKE
jgi:hypothetical protein